MGDLIEEILLDRLLEERFDADLKHTAVKKVVVSHKNKIGIYRHSVEAVGEVESLVSGVGSYHVNHTAFGQTEMMAKVIYKLLLGAFNKCADVLV